MMGNVVLNVDGMSCVHCENRVKKAVGALNGVKTVEVNLSEKTVSVTFDSAVLQEDQIREAIDGQGYIVK
jgi:copper ion binding protein